MAKINEYPQAATVNNNDLFVIDQQTAGEHATKSASVAQIAEKATEEVNDKIGNLSSLTTTNKDSLVDAVNEVNGNLSTRLVGAWIADTSTSTNTYLTDEITVEAGTYLIIMSYPDISTTTFVATLYNKTTSSTYDNAYMFAQSLGAKAVLTAFSGTGKICIASAQSGSCNFTNKNRGSIRAIKLSNLY